MIDSIFRIILFLSILLCTSCAIDFKKENPKIRLVDINGNSRKIVTRIPDLNLKALANQGKLYSATKDMMNVNNSHDNKDKLKSFKANKIFKKNKPVIKAENSKIKADTAKNSNKAKNNFASFSASTIENSLAKNNVNNKESIKEVEYDLSNNKLVTNKDTKSSKKQKLSSQKNSSKALISQYKPKKNVYVQVGSFSKKDNANKFLKYMSKFNKGEIQSVKTISGIIFRVVLGPFSNIDSANKTVKMVKNSGHDALILVNK